MAIEFSKIKSGNHSIGLVSLNRPGQLNVLNLEMVTKMVDQLQKWESDDEVAAVIFHSNDGKAFSAGGDVKEVRESILRTKEDSRQISRIRDFFFHEYLTDFLNYTYQKPVITWAEGITMGAGVGLLRSAHFRIVSGECVFAMPEMGIGFFPDVGASWFLHKIPDGIGKYLGLTGVRFNAKDAMEWKLGTHFIDFNKKNEVFREISKISWGKGLKERQEQISKALGKFNYVPKLKAEIMPMKDTIHKIMEGQTVRDFSENLKSHAPLPHMALIYNASPLSIAVTYELFKRSKSWKLGEAFANEWVMAIKFCRDGDFAEGVRALLVDKDKKPQWHFKDILKVPEELINGYFNFQMLKYENPWEKLISQRKPTVE